MSKILLLVVAFSVLVVGGTAAQKAVATGKGCVTVQGITACGPDIPDNPTLICTDASSCDSGANNDPQAPVEATGDVTDDPPVDDPQAPATDTTGDTTQPGSATSTTTGTATVPGTTVSDSVTVAPKPSFCEATPTADVGVSNSLAGGDITQGSMVSYSLDVFDSKSPECSAPNASLSDQLPPQLELLSVGAVTTEQGSCQVEGGVGNQHITCSFGTLDAGQHVKVSITARVDKTGTVSDQACVESSSTDPNRGDNQCSTAVFTTTPVTPSSTSTNQAEPQPVQQQPKGAVRLPPLSVPTDASAAAQSEPDVTPVPKQPAKKASDKLVGLPALPTPTG